ncbi:DNA-directed RNA polymerases I and III subunit RPAC2 isoform 1-T1 [Acanthopagrus schlegelii]
MAGEGEKKPVLEMIQADGADEGCVTFVLHDEDHTLGNSLRYMIMKTLDVEFCGYTITHPSESKINFRIQTRDAWKIFPHGLITEKGTITFQAPKIPLVSTVLSYIQLQLYIYFCIYSLPP